MARKRPSHGFTLIEVLVALAIVALALAAGVQASNALLLRAQRQSDAVLAQLCAENALVHMRLSRQMPSTGTTRSTCEQAGRNLGVLVSVFPTPNPSFRRVEARISEGPQEDAYPLLTLVTVVGRF